MYASTLTPCAYTVLHEKFVGSLLLTQIWAGINEQVKVGTKFMSTNYPLETACMTGCDRENKVSSYFNQQKLSWVSKFGVDLDNFKMDVMVELSLT